MLDSSNKGQERRAAGALSEKREVEYLKFRETLTDNADGNPEPSSDIKIREGAETLRGKPKSIVKKTCAYNECSNLTQNKKYCCTKCYRAQVREENNIPKVPEILEAFDKYKSFLQVGKHFNVSDNCVRKWCDSYGIMDMVKRKSSAQTS